MKLFMASLGCAKNLIDSETMLDLLRRSGWTITQDPDAAHLIVVNTCSFIEPAINESVDTILELANLKKEGNCRKLIVAGCLPQRFGEEIARALPEVDIFLGTTAFDRIVQAANIQASESQGPECFLSDPGCIDLSAPGRSHSVCHTPHAAYIKIAEGCSRHCTYCIIPKLRGSQKSRLPEDIIAEAMSLVQTGVEELTLVAQDTTSYGDDLGNPANLSQLLKRISDISQDVWIRFLYGHPERIDDTLIRTVAEQDNICTYFDIPIQHASNRVLKRMGRNYSQDDLYRLFDRIRSFTRDAALRTTVIVGFPGETEDDFESLLRFAEDIRFDHLGTFLYSDADDLVSHRLRDHVPEKIAQERYDRLMSRQSEISFENNQKYLGKVIDTLVEELSPSNGEQSFFTGRTAFQAPEVDGITYISGTESSKLRIGQIIPVKITDALEYDLIGEVRGER